MDHGLSVQEKILIEQRVTNDAKSAGVAYALWFFTGWAGGHRFYLGHNGTAATLLILTIIGWLTVVIGIGIIALLVVGVWLLVDAFLIPGIIVRQKEEVRSRLTMEAVSSQRSVTSAGL